MILGLCLGTYSGHTNTSFFPPSVVTIFFFLKKSDLFYLQLPHSCQEISAGGIDDLIYDRP